MKTNKAIRKLESEGYSRNEIRDKLLKTPYGTIRNLMVKKFMFCLVSELSDNICYRCGCKIDSEDTFSIEHKIPWLNSDDPLGNYFNIDNISFSHILCNSLHKTKFFSFFMGKKEREKLGMSEGKARNILIRKIILKLLKN